LGTAVFEEKATTGLVVEVLLVVPCCAGFNEERIWNVHFKWAIERVGVE
jgi:hypothetical protein